MIVFCDHVSLTRRSWLWLLIRHLMSSECVTFSCASSKMFLTTLEPSRWGSTRTSILTTCQASQYAVGLGIGVAVTVITFNACTGAVALSVNGLSGLMVGTTSIT